MIDRISFMYIFICINAILLLSYVIFEVGKRDFGDVHPRYHSYMLICAGIAYLINLVHVFFISTSDRMDCVFQLAAISYYLLQLLFIPLVRLKKPNLVRILLLLCVAPIAYIHSLSTKMESFFSGYVLFHVAINDFLLYGFLHG